MSPEMMLGAVVLVTGLLTLMGSAMTSSTRVSSTAILGGLVAGFLCLAVISQAAG